jgi:hypothetical protein
VHQDFNIICYIALKFWPLFFKPTMKRILDNFIAVLHVCANSRCVQYFMLLQAERITLNNDSISCIAHCNNSARR